MTIVVNGGDYKLQVNEDYLVVKNEHLYNTKTKSYEGIEGDIISFNYNNDGVKGGYKGYVEGYTNGVTARLRGIDKTFNVVGPISVTHISRVSDVEDIDDIEKEMSKAAE